MNEIQIFNNAQFGNVRVIMENGKPLFCGKDVAESLGYSDTAKAIRMHCKGVAELSTPTSGGMQKMKYIPEGDLYRLITHSQLPDAERFESWVFDEVLPALRQTGSYSSISKATDAQAKTQIAEAKLLNARSRASSMWFKFSNMLDNPEHKQLCAAYGTQVLTGGKMVLPLPQVEHTYSAQEVADMYGITANRVGRIANENRLKTEKYGHLVMDVAKHCQGKTVQSFRYNETGARAIGELARKQ